MRNPYREALLLAAAARAEADMRYSDFVAQGTGTTAEHDALRLAIERMQAEYDRVLLQYVLENDRLAVQAKERPGRPN